MVVSETINLRGFISPSPPKEGGVEAELNNSEATVLTQHGWLKINLPGCIFVIYIAEQNIHHLQPQKLFALQNKL